MAVNHQRRSPPYTAIYSSLSLDQVYAALLYYLRNRPEIENYLGEWFTHGQKMRLEEEQQLPPVIARLRQLSNEQSTLLLSYLSLINH